MFGFALTVEILLALLGDPSHNINGETLSRPQNEDVAIMLRAYSRVGRNINVVNKNRIFGGRGIAASPGDGPRI
jgi:hypothetical protein